MTTTAGETALLRNKDGTPGKWLMEFNGKSFNYRCQLIIDGRIYSGSSKTPERAMRNAVNKYLRQKQRI